MQISAEKYFIYRNGEIVQVRKWVKDVWVFLGGTGGTETGRFESIDELEAWLNE